MQPCADAPISKMWDAWQGRRAAPEYHYAGQDLLTLWPSYVLQLPYYLVHPFNSDPGYRALFKAQWLAEWAYYNSSSYFAGEQGRYGVSTLDKTNTKTKTNQASHA